jgi:hypothetical protein
LQSLEKQPVVFQNGICSVSFTICDTLADTEWEEMDRFLAQTYRPSYIMRDRALFDWQFGRSMNPGVRTVVCGWRDGKLIGMLGYIPLSLHWGNGANPFQGAWMANWIVAGECRTGVGAILMRRLQEIFPLLLGQGANSTNKLVAHRMGFKIYDSIPRCVAVFKRNRASTLFTSQNLCLLSEWQFRQNKLPTSKFVLALDTSVYDPDWCRYSAMNYGTRRSLEYLNWRYFEHPYFQYVVIIAGPCHEPALCVYRIEAVDGNSDELAGRIVEFFHADSEDGMASGATVLSSALREMSLKGCVFADLYTTSNLFLSSAILSGMTNATDLQLVSRLNPVDCRWRPQNLEVWTADSLPQSPILSQLYVTKSDGDQDRPNRA